jgi:replicative DNA helicase Mcm
MFLLGDPGAGKTDFGEAMVALSERARKTSANSGTSAAGLTAAMTKDDFSDSEWTIEAGDIPHCTDGSVFIDELNTASTEEQNAMLEAMESQVINISKGGEKATLEADTAILAAGNPDSGHFEEGVPPADQTSVVSPLIDRFDLIFCPREMTDREDIEALGGHIADDRDVQTRRERGLDVDPDKLQDVSPRIDTDALHAYLHECRKLKPVFASQAVKEALVNWYVETKTRLVAREEKEGRTIPVTPRTQQDVIRLAEAAAKARHSETIEMVDAERATRLKSRSFRELGLDPGPDVEIRTDDSGEQVVSTASTPTAAIVDAVEELKMIGSQYGAAREDVATAAAEGHQNLTADDAENLVDQLLAADELNEPTPGRLTI